MPTLNQSIPQTAPGVNPAEGASASPSRLSDLLQKVKAAAKEKWGVPDWVPQPIQRAMKEWTDLNLAAAKRKALGDYLGYSPEFQETLAPLFDKTLSAMEDLVIWDGLDRSSQTWQDLQPLYQERKETVQWLENILQKMEGSEEEPSKQKQDEELTMDAVGGILSKKQRGRRFPSEELLTGHHKKHMKQFGEISVEEYLDLANALADSPLSDDVVQLVRSDGSISKYCFSTNEFVVVDPDGTIKTFFRPEKGRRYWEHELDRNK